MKIVRADHPSRGRISTVFVAVALLVGCRGGGNAPPEDRGSHHQGHEHRDPAAAGEGPAEHGAEGDEGGHGGHRFAEAERWARHFESPNRDQWQRPQLVIGMLGLTEESVVADIGSATGYFPVRIAPRVPRGRVWGVDIEPDMVRYLNERARREGIGNLFSVLGTPGDPLIPEPVDVILVVNTYHHITDRTGYFRRLQASLRPGGRLAIVDYRPGELPMGPPPDEKIPPDQIGRELEGAGYRVVREDRDTLPYQFVMIATVAGSGEGGE